MTRKFIIHIGSEKTGTSSLQEQFSNKQDQISPFVLYPIWGRDDGAPHHAAFYQEYSKGNQILNTDEFKAELKCSNKDVFISCEHFSFLDEKSLSALELLVSDATKQGFEVTILYVLREMFSYLKSLYFESIKWGETAEFNQFTEKYSYRLEADRIAELAYKLRCDVVFLKYDSDSAINNKRITKYIHPDLQNVITLNSSGVMNKGYDVYDTSVLLYFNKIYKQPNFTRELILLLNKANKNIPTKGRTAPAPDFLDSLTQLKLETISTLNHIQSTDTIRRELFITGNNEFLISPDRHHKAAS